jgi:sulfide:quinone oxidoreductase
MLIESSCRRRGIRDRTQIDFYAAEAGPMGVAGAAVSSAVRQMMEAKGIAYHPERKVASADPQARRLAFANGTDAAFDLLAYVPVHRAPRVVGEAGLLSENGWIPVDRRTLETKFEHVSAVGDINTIPLTMGKPLPKAGVFAEREAEVVARNIAREITGRGEEARFDGVGECFIETGDGKAGIGKGDFYAEPAPQVRIRPPARRWHAAKVLFEKHFLRRWL